MFGNKSETRTRLANWLYIIPRVRIRKGEWNVSLTGARMTRDFPSFASNAGKRYSLVYSEILSQRGFVASRMQIVSEQGSQMRVAHYSKKDITLGRTRVPPTSHAKSYLIDLVKRLHYITLNRFSPFTLSYTVDCISCLTRCFFAAILYFVECALTIKREGKRRPSVVLRTKPWELQSLSAIRSNIIQCAIIRSGSTNGESTIQLCIFRPQLDLFIVHLFS